MELLSKSKPNNYAFIDSQNMNLAIRSQGWVLDLNKFRVYLRDKYGVQKAFFFIGYVPGNERKYQEIQEAGFICIFKPTMELPDGTVKGNVDADMVMYATLEINNCDKIVLVTGDGDFQGLVRHLISCEKLEALLVPHKGRCSALFKVFKILPFLRFMNDLREKIGK